MMDAIVSFMLGAWCAQLYINYITKREIKELFARVENDPS